MRLQVTEKGVHGKDGEQIPVGSIVEFDSIPGFLVNKWVVVPESKNAEERTLEVATPENVTEETESEEDEEARLRDEYYAMTGEYIGGRASLETVRKRHAEAKANQE